MRMLGNFGYFPSRGGISRELRLLLLQIAAALLLTLLMARLAQAQATLQVVTPKGDRTGVAFPVSKEGYWATSYQLVQGATSARLVFDNQRSFAVEGFVAARKDHDVIILASQDAADPFPRPRLAGVQLKVGDGLFPLVGPFSESLPRQLILPELVDARDRGADFTQRIYTPKLARITNGAELMAGWEKPEPDMPGAGIDTQWLMMDVGLNPNCAGAPIFDTNLRNNIIGMLSGLVTPDRLARLVVHVRHVDDLVPAGQAPIHKLGTLAKFEASKTATNLAVPTPPADSSLAQRGLPLAERYVKHNERVNLIEKSAAEAGQIVAKAKAKGLGELAAIDAVRSNLQSMQPEETFVDTETVVIPGDIVDGRRQRDRIETRRVTRRRFSQRQLALMATAQRTIGEKGLELAGSRAMVQDGEFAGPWMERRAETARRELFYLADPLELRCVADHRELELKLNEIIADGGAPGWVFLARGLCKLRLRKLDEAEADFRDAADIDNELSNLVQMAEGRRQHLLGNSAKGAALVSKSVRIGKDDPAVLTLQARLELDRKAYSAAIRTLNQALEAGGDTAELHQALAWIYGSMPGSVSNGRLAITHAQQACSLTGHKDWSALTALAGAFARAEKPDDATAALKEAELLVPKHYIDQFQTWQAALAAKHPLERTW